MKGIWLALYYTLGNKISSKLGGNRIRYFLVKKIIRKCGKNVSVFENVYIGNGKYLEIGNDCVIGADCRFIVNDKIIIGNDTQLAPNVTILTGNHNFEDRDILFRKQGVVTKPVIIGNDVWVAANVTILPGVTISDSSVIAAGAVVNKSYEKYAIIGGNPCKLIRLKGINGDSK